MRIRQMAGWPGGDKGAGGSMEGQPVDGWLCAGLHQRHGIGHQWAVPFFGMGRIPGEIPAGTAQIVSGGEPGADPRGVRPAAYDSLRDGSETALPADGNARGNRHAGERSTVYHGGGSPARLCGNRAQGQDSRDPAFRQAVPQAATVRESKGFCPEQSSARAAAGR